MPEKKFALSLALDVLNTDVELQEDYGARFVKSGRWVLLAGVAGGYALSLVRRPHPLVVDILTAAFPAFLAGVLVFWLLHVALGAAD